MNLKRFYPLLLITLLSHAAVVSAATHASAADDPESRLVFLRNAQVEIGIFPEVAGSVVVFRKPGGQNFLFVHPEDWLEWEPTIPDPLNIAEWTDFFGHIIWLGPQSDFWTQQDLLPTLQGRYWPPDPYLVYGAYEVLEHSADTLSLEGPPSPYTGVKLTKTYRLNGSTVEMEITATNTSGKVLNWDIWSNTRVPPKWPFLVPVAGKADVRPEPETLNLIDWTSDGGYFSFDLAPPAEGDFESAKAFVTAAQPWIAAFSDDTVFVKAFDPVEPDRISPRQSLVEVYYRKTSEPGVSFVELEAHGPYTELQPGETLTFHETWTLMPFDGENTRESRIEWAKKNLD